MYASVARLNEAKQGSIGLSVLGLGLRFEGLLLKAQCMPGHTLSMLSNTTYRRNPEPSSNRLDSNHSRP